MSAPWPGLGCPRSRGSTEAGRGACAGPLVVAAVTLDPGRLQRLRDIADSKALSPAARDEAYAEGDSIRAGLA